MPSGIYQHKRGYKRHPNSGFQKGHKVNVGKHWKLSEEHKKKKSEMLKGRSSSLKGRKIPNGSLAKMGSKNPRWNPDREQVMGNKRDNTNAEYHLWARSVKRRDNWKCKISNVNCKGKVMAHHILNWVDFIEERYNINNGITLCHAHHPRGRAKEQLLVPTFQELISQMN